jgi:hypothetical protein
MFKEFGENRKGGLEMDKEDREVNEEINKMGAYEKVDRASEMDKISEIVKKENEEAEKGIERLRGKGELENCQITFGTLKRLLKDGIIDERMSAGELPDFMEDYLLELQKKLDEEE